MKNSSSSFKDPTQVGITAALILNGLFGVHGKPPDELVPEAVRLARAIGAETQKQLEAEADEAEAAARSAGE